MSWKIPYILPLFFSKRFLLKNKSKSWIRNSIIPNSFLNKTFYVYNGRIHLPVLVKSDMIGRKFGEFSITKSLGYKVKKKSKRIKKR